ncbi:unnamed protein product [Eruca vesicaria subsp. sativa]|uniref:Uncharacterized protein n=1 Tax=Eruca vesicaria subsp. sativa TaxID=29727 RepID=A0ABC8M1S4_ERUVS|nr:unnamed protein product [Eruca vesicaria subsp. sativa]
MIYERDFMKHTMLEHDAVFKNQVHELHRLYRVQRNLVDEVKGKNSNEEGSSSQACNGRLPNKRRMIDLELPANEFLDMDETGDTDEITTCLPYKRLRSAREDGSHQSNYSSGSCLDVKNSNGLADLNEPLNWQDSEPVAALSRSRDMYSHYGRSDADVQRQWLEKNTSQNGWMVLGAGHDRSTQGDLHLPSHSAQVRSNSAVQPLSYLTTDHNNARFSRERGYPELEVRATNPQASYDSYVASNAPRLHNDYRHDFVGPWSQWSSPWENPRSSSHQRSYPVQTNPYKKFVSHARTDSSFEMRNPVPNGIHHGFSSGSKEATFSFPSGGFRPNASLGEVVKHQSSESLQGPKKQESSAGFPWLKPKPSYKSEISNGFFDLNVSTDQFEGTDAGDGLNGVSPQKGLVSSASYSNNANMGRFKMVYPQSNVQLIGCPQKEHAPLISHSADQHKEVNHLVKRDFDINLPCDASVSADQYGSKAFCAEKEEGNKAVNNRHYIDLNSCASEDDENSSMHPSLRVKTKGNSWIDLEAPPALESEEEGGGSQEKSEEETWGFMKGQDANSLDELIKEAAQAIVAISLSDHQRHPDDAASSSADTASKSPLSWFADFITSWGDELERKVDGSPEATDFEGYREEYTSGEIDYFEAMTLNLRPTKEEDYMPEPLVPKNLILEGTGVNRLRRGQARRGRPKRDFQRDTLPGLSSLSRQEVTEDMQLFGGLMKTKEHTWSSGVASRRNSKRKRTVTNISQTQVCPSTAQHENVSVAGLEESKLTGWGKATRRPRRQRCPPAGNPATVIYT